VLLDGAGKAPYGQGAIKRRCRVRHRVIFTPSRETTILPLLSLLIAFSAVTAQAGTIWDELTPAQQAQISNGSQVFITRDVPGAPWPRAWVYQRVASTPEEAAAVFADYEAATTFAPDLKVATISARVDPRTTEVTCTIGVPIMGDVHYIVRNTVTKYSAGAGYRVDWTLVRSNSMKSSEGNIRFEARGSGTLVAYYSWVVPNSIFARAVRRHALGGLRDTVARLVKRIEGERTAEQPLLQKQLAALRAALAP
jgi:Polyketide cyclase / dehydrase and lipid transport